MGKASSAKKVARAARAGGRSSSGQPRSFLFPGMLSLVLVLGVSLVVFARAERQSVDMGGVPQFGDHIHMAFGVNACDEWLPDLPEFESRVGIHTHGDGVIHVHPFSGLGVGANATLGRYLRDVADPRSGNMEVALDDATLVWQGEEFENNEGGRCPDVDNPLLRVAFWENVGDPAEEPRITTGGFNNIRLNTDGAGLTVFYGAPDAEIPRPPTADQLAELGAVDGATPPPLQSDPPDDVEAVEEGVIDEEGNIVDPPPVDDEDVPGSRTPPEPATDAEADAGADGGDDEPADAEGGGAGDDEDTGGDAGQDATDQ
jgi:hypothetical protein